MKHDQGRSVALHALLLAALVAATCMASPATAAAPCQVHVLVERAGAIDVEAVSMPAGEEVVYADSAIVSVVLPFGSGQSGDVIQRGQRARELRFRCANGAVQTRIVRSNGQTRDLPSVTTSDLDAYDMRVNVTGAGGYQVAFAVSGGTAVRAGGPVLDMFQGRIPLSPGDFAITTEVIPRRTVPRLVGEITLTFAEDLIFTMGSNPTGRPGEFIVDLGAGTTVVGRDFLPDGTTIEPLVGIEYSEKGERLVPGAMGGAGGAVSSLLGVASLDSLKIGRLVVRDLRVNVVTEMPRIGSREIAGILGLDVLSRTERLRFDRGEGSNGTLAFVASDAPALEIGAHDLDIPFTMVAKHIVLDAALGDSPCALVLDSGARASLVPKAFAQELGLRASQEAVREFRGLDGKPLAGTPVVVETLRLGESVLSDVTFYSTELPVVESMGLGNRAALLGNNFLSRYATLEVDFANLRARLVGPR